MINSHEVKNTLKKPSEKAPGRKKCFERVIRAMFDKMGNLSRARKLVHELDQTDRERWLEFGVLTFRWWLLVAFLIVPWIIWAKLSDKSKTLEVVLVGSIVMLVTLLLDVLGYNADFWDYPVELLPLGVPGALPFDLSLIPVPYMLIYQHFRTWKSYLLALFGMAAVYAFIGEPLANWLELVRYLKWNVVYSFIYYIVIGVGVRALVMRLASKYTA
jgi:hypothetical protein